MRTLFFILFFSTIGYTQTIQVNCDVEKASYRIFVKEGAYPGVESSMIVPRDLTVEEKCIVRDLRKEDEDVLLSLDAIHEVIIYARTKIK